MTTPPRVPYILVAIYKPIEKVRHLPNYECIEYVVYYAQMAEFNIISMMFFTQICYIQLKHCERYNIICNTI